MRLLSGPLLLLYSTLVIIMFGFGIIMPIMPFYVTHFGASGQQLGLLMAIYALMQFIFSRMWGRLSDRTGRKPVLLIDILGFTLPFTFMGFSQSYLQLLLARAMAGILSSASMPAIMAYIADKTDHNQRAAGMGLMGAFMGVGMILGLMFGGYITDWQMLLPVWLDGLLQTSIDPVTGLRANLSLPFLFAAGMAMIAGGFTIFFLPESLPPEKRTAPQRVKTSRFTMLGNALVGPIGFLLLAAFLTSFTLSTLEAVLGLFGKQRFGLSPSELGSLMGIIGLLSIIQQGVVIGPLTDRRQNAHFQPTGWYRHVSRLIA